MESTWSLTSRSEKPTWDQKNMNIKSFSLKKNCGKTKSTQEKTAFLSVLLIRFSPHCSLGCSDCFCNFHLCRADPLGMPSSKWSHLTRRSWWPKSATKRQWRTGTLRSSSAPQRRWALFWWEEPWTAAASLLHPANFPVSPPAFHVLQWRTSSFLFFFFWRL